MDRSVPVAPIRLSLLGPVQQSAVMTKHFHILHPHVLKTCPNTTDSENHIYSNRMSMQEASWPNRGNSNFQYCSPGVSDTVAVQLVYPNKLGPGKNMFG